MTAAVIDLATARRYRDVLRRAAELDGVPEPLAARVTPFWLRRRLPWVRRRRIEHLAALRYFGSKQPTREGA